MGLAEGAELEWSASACESDGRSDRKYCGSAVTGVKEQGGLEAGVGGERS